jgi:hypothetical protein
MTPNDAALWDKVCHHAYLLRLTEQDGKDD